MHARSRGAQRTFMGELHGRHPGPDSVKGKCKGGHEMKCSQCPKTVSREREARAPRAEHLAPGMHQTPLTITGSPRTDPSRTHPRRERDAGRSPGSSILLFLETAAPYLALKPAPSQESKPPPRPVSRPQAMCGTARA